MRLGLIILSSEIFFFSGLYKKNYIVRIDIVSSNPKRQNKTKLKRETTE